MRNIDPPDFLVRLVTESFQARLERSWIEHLVNAYAYANWAYLDKALRLPLIELGDSTANAGAWDPAKRTITISRHHILGEPWEVVDQTLRHEMAHQYVDEALKHGPWAGRPHGDAFAHACRLLRCDAAATLSAKVRGTIGSSSEPCDRILTRIKELLALANSPNEHEAATAMRLARRELARYNLSLAHLETPRNYGVRYLCRGSKRIHEYVYMLAHILHDHFFVRPIWLASYDARHDRDERILEISGTPENLDVAEYVFTYVMTVANTFWEEYKRTQPKGGALKVQYLAGLLQGFSDKLKAEAATLKDEERALILVGDRRLNEYYAYHHPRIRTFRSGGVSLTGSFEDGQKDGKKIILRRPIVEKTNRGGALPAPGGG